jgi:phage I-like protein
MPLLLTAILSASLALQAGAAVQILPSGRFAGRSGRPGAGMSWELSDGAGAALAAALNARHAEGRAQFNFDYDHQTMLVASTGAKAPASGWASKFEWRPGVGLFAVDVQWTAAAAEHIRAGEYRYISPVIVFDEATGQVNDVLHASLTNFPDLMQMAPLDDAVAALNALSNPPQEMPVNLLTQLLSALGLAAGTTEAQALAAVAALKTKADTPPAKPAALSAAVATALGLAGDVDEATALSAVATIKSKATGLDATTMQTIQTLQGQVATLTARITEGEVTALVDGAIAEGKLLPAQRDWALSLGKGNVAQLSAYLATAPKVAAGLGATQSGGAAPAGDNKPAAPEGTQLAVLSAMGLTAEQFAAAAATA